jgi:hypothetical protein
MARSIQTPQRHIQTPVRTILNRLSDQRHFALKISGHLAGDPAC